jgi:methylmalonyl-CoA mutase N-terminal domain/subunit
MLLLPQRSELTLAGNCAYSAQQETKLLIRFTRPAMIDRKETPWLFRTYAGHSTAKASNALYRTNLAKGQTGLSVAFDLPTQTGYDSDHELARWRIWATCGHCSPTSRWIR